MLPKRKIQSLLLRQSRARFGCPIFDAQDSQKGMEGGVLEQHQIEPFWLFY